MNEISQLHDRIRNILKRHKLTEVGDGVLEADLIYGVLDLITLPQRKPYQHGRDFFQGEGQEVANAKIDGWNECLEEIQNQFAKKYRTYLKFK